MEAVTTTGRREMAKPVTKMQWLEALDAAEQAEDELRELFRDVLGLDTTAIRKACAKLDRAVRKENALRAQIAAANKFNLCGHA